MLKPRCGMTKPGAAVFVLDVGIFGPSPFLRSSGCFEVAVSVAGHALSF